MKDWKLLWALCVAPATGLLCVAMLVGCRESGTITDPAGSSVTVFGTIDAAGAGVKQLTLETLHAGCAGLAGTTATPAVGTDGRYRAVLESPPFSPLAYACVSATVLVETAPGQDSALTVQRDSVPFGTSGRDSVRIDISFDSNS